MAKKNTKTILFVFILTAFLHLFYETCAYASSRIVDERTLSDWGYRIIVFGVMEQTKWEASTFGDATIYLQKIKAIKEVPDWPNTYYRFTLTREEYLSDKKAKKRLRKLHKTPPNINTKKHSEYVLRKGFRKENFVYIISTDVLKFEMEELPRIFDLLEMYFVSDSL